MLQECGADCAKFQKSELEYKFNRKALERPYTSKHSWGKTYGEHKRHLEFSHEQYRELQRYAQEVGIFFTASGMDEVSPHRAAVICYRCLVAFGPESAPAFAHLRLFLCFVDLEFHVTLTASVPN